MYPYAGWSLHSQLPLLLNMAPRTSAVVALAILLVQVTISECNFVCGGSGSSNSWDTGYEGGSSGGYEGGFSGYQGGSSGYEGGFSGHQGGSSGYEGGLSGYQGGSSGYEGGFSGYQGGSAASSDAYASGSSGGSFAEAHAEASAGSSGSGHGGVVEGLCPGPVVEKEIVVNKAVQVPYTYAETVQSRKCFQKHGSQRSVNSNTFSNGQNCRTQVVNEEVPQTETTVEETPLVKKDCTVTDYILQIPIRDVVCKNSGLCRRTVRQQQNALTTTSRRTSCDGQVCSQDRVTVTPTTDTVCQTYQTTIPKVGVRTVNKQEVVVKRVQLPPHKCLKPIHDNGYLGY